MTFEGHKQKRSLFTMSMQLQVLTRRIFAPHGNVALQTLLCGFGFLPEQFSFAVSMGGASLSSMDTHVTASVTFEALKPHLSGQVASLTFHR